MQSPIKPLNAAAVILPTKVLFNPLQALSEPNVLKLAKQAAERPGAAAAGNLLT